MNLCDQKSTECKYEDWKKKVQANIASEALADSICGKKTSVQKPNDKMSFSQIFAEAMKTLQ